MKTEKLINLKSREEIVILREAGKILAEIVEELKSSLTSGMSTKEVDALAEELIARRHVIPAFKGYRGFPGCICLSVNEQVVHGVPGRRLLKEGDIVSIDVGIIYKDYYSDTALTCPIGQITDELKRLLEVTEKSLYVGIAQAQVEHYLSDISHAVQTYVEANNMSVVRDFVGHGIGKHLHEDPEIPNFGAAGGGPLLKEGMVLAIEPMVTMGRYDVEVLSDGWTAVTKDRSLAAHFEHTVALMEHGPEILTELTNA